MDIQKFLTIIFMASWISSCIPPEKRMDKMPSNLMDVDARSYYIYPSVLRMANLSQSPDLNKLIKDVDRVDVHILRSEKPDVDLITIALSLRKKGFSELISARSGDDGWIKLQSSGKGGKEIFVAMGTYNDIHMFVEFRGPLRIEYLNAIGEADWSLLTDHISGDFGLGGDGGRNDGWEEPFSDENDSDDSTQDSIN